MMHVRKIHRIYSGRGKLVFEDDLVLSVTFEATQDVADGILIDCQHISAERIQLSGENNLFTKKVLSFNGRTDKGYLFQAEAVQVKSFTIPWPKKDGWHFRIGLRAGKLTISDAFQIQPEELVIFKFNLANLTLEPDEIVRSDDGGLYLGRFSVNLDGLPFIFRPIEQYQETIKDLRYTHGVAVTYTLSVIAAKQDIEKIVQAVDDICMLLSLARGTKVNWISCDISTLCNDFVHSIHLDAITKPFGSLSIICSEHTPGEINNTRHFLEQCYPVFQETKDEWELEKAIHGYVDGLLKGDFLEAKALKLVVVIEFLKGRYLENTDSVYILSEEEFQSKQSALKHAVKEAIQHTFPDITSDLLEMMVNHAQGMNWFPFRRAIKGMLHGVGLPVDNKDINRFIIIRNRLVHQMNFPGKTHDERVEQYFFVMMFVGRVLLAILQYQGYYNDWADPMIDRPFWPETILKRLVLEQHKE